MKYKILYVKNRYKKNPNFKRGIEWFKDNTPIEIDDGDHIETDFDVNSMNVSNSTWSGVAVAEDIYDKLRPLIAANKYHAVVFLYGNDMPGIRINVAHSNPILPGTAFLQIYQDSDGGKTLNHELIHTFFHRLRWQGIYLADPMDYVLVNGQVMAYYNNDNMNAVPSNRSIALALLQPYWNNVTMMTPSSPVPTPTPSQPKYSWFTMNEKTGPNHTFSELDSRLRLILDTARSKAGVPFLLTSGLRTVAENKAAGGASNSAHLRGLAADIYCTDSAKRSAILRGLLTCGSDVFLEVANKHIHVDIDSNIHPLGGTILDPNDD